MCQKAATCPLNILADIAGCIAIIWLYDFPHMPQCWKMKSLPHACTREKTPDQIFAFVTSFLNLVNHLLSLRSWASHSLVRECLFARYGARARSAFWSQYKAPPDTFHPLLCGNSNSPLQTDHNKTHQKNPTTNKWSPLLSPSSQRERTARPLGMMLKPVTMKPTPTSRSWGNLLWSAGRPRTCTHCRLLQLQKVKVETLGGIFGRSDHMNWASDNTVSLKIHI